MDKKQTIRIGDWAVSPSQNRIERDGQLVKLKPRAMDVLVYLADHAGEVISTEELINAVWRGRVVGDGTVYQSINQLRQALGSGGEQVSYIETIAKRGYRLAADVELVPDDAMRKRPQRRGILAATAVVVAAAFVVVIWMLPGDDVSASVAVLPFVDMSEQKNQTYFADGVAEEIINVLSELDRLEVASRTSSFAFRDSTADAREIGEQLNVKAILEGSIRKSDEELRVTVQLIDVATGFHLWSENFDHRQPEDIFVIQEDIAGAVAGALGVTFGVGDVYQIKGAGTQNIEAYEAYLRGDYDRAIELDSNYASAWARAGIRFASMQWQNPPEQAQALKEKAYEFVSKAVELDPQLSHSTELATLKYALESDWGTSEQYFRQAMGKSHNDYTLRSFARMLTRAGRATAALDIRNEIRSLEARGGDFVWFNHYIALGEIEQARRYKQAMSLSPLGEAEARMILAIHEGSNENLQSALEDLAAVNSTNAVAFGPLTNVIESPGAALRHLREVFADRNIIWPSKYHDIALLAAYFGDAEFAFEVFSNEIYDTSIRFFALWYPVMADVRMLPEFKQFVRDVNLLDYWRAHGWSDYCRPIDRVDFVCDRVP